MLWVSLCFPNKCTDALLCLLLPALNAVTMIYRSPHSIISILVPFNSEWQMQKPGSREVSSLRPHSQQVSDLGFKSRQPDFSICALNLCYLLPLRSTLSSGGQLAFTLARKPDSKYRKPNMTVSFPWSEPASGSSLLGSVQAPWHDILGFPGSGLFPAAPLNSATLPL